MTPPLRFTLNPDQDHGRYLFGGDLSIEEFGQSGAAPDVRTMRGHAAVFNRLSHDLGGFKVKIAPGFFTNVLDSQPDVHLVWDHDTRYTLARTRSQKYGLELREDPVGLHVWSRMAPVSYADDLAVLMDGGVIDQMSFACDIGADEWHEDDSGITRTLLECDALYDVTICAQGAFPQTDSRLATDLASAIEAGRVEGRAEGAAPPEDTTHTAAPETEDGEEVAAGASGIAARHAALKARARVATRI
jgi:HK97 family phage prohead protease